MEEKDSKPRESGPVIFDGMILPPFPPLVQDAKKRFEEVRNMEYRKDDIILAIYPKSGRTIFFLNMELYVYKRWVVNKSSIRFNIYLYMIKSALKQYLV